MAIKLMSFFFILSTLLLTIVSSETRCRNFKSIISFGDSIADTGNLLALSSPEDIPPAFPPYGETFFHHPNGRFSDGRLIIDFIANFVYADYYNALLPLFQVPAEFGFVNTPLLACCGLRGPYNYDFRRTCGSVGVGYCTDPSKYVNWDGVHMTEAAYRFIADGLLKGPHAIPSFDWSCLSSEIKNKESLDTQYSLMNS